METILEQLSSTTWIEWTIAIVLNVVLLICLVTDLKDHKVYNWVTYPTIVFAFLINTIGYGMTGFTACCLNLLDTLLIFWLFYLLKWIGGGDVKLIMAISALTSISFSFTIVIVSCFLAGFYGMYLWIRTDIHKKTIPFAAFLAIGVYVYELGMWIVRL